MRNFYYCLLFTLLLSTPGWAQFSNTLAQAGRNRELEKQLLRTQPLLVLLKREDPKQLKKLAGKPAELKHYCDYIAFTNTLLREVAGPAWTISPTVEYKTQDEIEALAAANTGQLNVLDLDFVKYADSPSPMNHSWNAGNVQLPSGSSGLPSLRLQVYVKKAEFTIHSEPLLAVPFNDSDVLYALRMVETYAAGTGPKLLKMAAVPPALLLCQDDRAPDLTDAQIKQVYPYAYQFLPRPEYEQAVREAKPGFAFVRMSWQGYSIISPMAYVLPGFGFVCGGSLHKLKEEQITLKDFKSFKKTLQR